MTDDRADNRRSALPALLLRRIDEAYGGNQAACARALDISSQHLSALINGKIRTPRAELRRALGRELGLSQLRLLVLTGEVAPDDPELPPDPPPALVRVVGMLRDPRMGPQQLAAVEAVARSLLAGAPAADGAPGGPGRAADAGHPG